MKIIVKRRTLYSPMQKKNGIWDQKSFASDVSNMKRKCNIFDTVFIHAFMSILKYAVKSFMSSCDFHFENH